MKANAVALLAIFERKMRLEVPLFQRQYVWKKDKHWEPLWEDIARKFTEYLEGRKDAPVHFLGAMVLDQKQTPMTHVDKRQVIDGQQRLTTLQLFLAAFRDFCREHGCIDLAKECETFTLNEGMMVEPDVERFKVWPTQLDRSQFADVVGSLSRVALEAKHPLVKKKGARKPEPRPRMVEGYIFFYDQLGEYFIGSPESAPLAAELPQTWIANWPLPDGTAGVGDEDSTNGQPQDPRAVATSRRNALLQTIGNLTVITQPLNSALSNANWADKEQALMLASLLPINLTLQTQREWNESTIEARSSELSDRALTLWPGPG